MLGYTNEVNKFATVGKLCKYIGTLLNTENGGNVNDEDMFKKQLS